MAKYSCGNRVDVGDVVAFVDSPDFLRNVKDVDGSSVKLWAEDNPCRWHPALSLRLIRRDLPPKPAEPAETRTHDTGAIRSTDADDYAFYCAPVLGIMRMGKTCRAGADKYAPFNWHKGFKASVLYDHAMRHMLLWASGDRSEDHLGHAAWNLHVIMDQEERGLVELMDCEPKGAS